jgi:VanZ family protein
LLRSKPSLTFAIGWSLVVTLLLCLPGTEFPAINWLNKIWFDKWVHIGLFLLLVILWCGAFSGKKSEKSKQKKLFIRIALLGFLYGIMLELVQHYFIPFRSFDYGDIVADGVGSFAGFIFSARRY